MRRFLIFASLATLASGVTACGGSPPEARAPAPKPASKAAAKAETAPAPARSPGVLYRAEVVEILDGGLGQFLQRVEVEPSLMGGRFRGFRIVDLRPEDFWQGVDLAAGDVVTSVNGMPIERETEAFAAFEALRKADALRVQYLRGGKERELVYRIVARDHANAKKLSGQAPEATKGSAKPAKK